MILNKNKTFFLTQNVLAKPAQQRQETKKVALTDRFLGSSRLVSHTRLAESVLILSEHGHLVVLAHLQVLDRKSGLIAIHLSSVSPGGAWGVFFDLDVVGCDAGAAIIGRGFPFHSDAVFCCLGDGDFAGWP